MPTERSSEKVGRWGGSETPERDPEESEASQRGGPGGADGRGGGRGSVRAPGLHRSQEARGDGGEGLGPGLRAEASVGGTLLSLNPRLCAPPGRQLESVRTEAAEKGDVGLVAENSRSTQRLMLPPPALTASGVFARFRDIAQLTGSAVSRAGRTAQPSTQTLCASPRGPKAV